jgi:hypothetical protein
VTDETGQDRTKSTEKRRGNKTISLAGGTDTLTEARRSWKFRLQQRLARGHAGAEKEPARGWWWSEDIAVYKVW